MGQLASSTGWEEHRHRLERRADPGLRTPTGEPCIGTNVSLEGGGCPQDGPAQQPLGRWPQESEAIEKTWTFFAPP